MSSGPTILWFRNDLRLADNTALAAALEAGGPIIPLYIHDPEASADWASGSASNWWLHHSLVSLEKSLQAGGGRLVIRAGQTAKLLDELVATTGATAVYWNHRYEGPLRELDASIKKRLFDAGIEVKTFNSSLLVEPHTVSTGGGQPYKVYTPFFKAVKDRPVPEPVVPNLDALSFPESLPPSETLASIGLLPEVHWSGEMEAIWDVSEAGAQARLERFMEQAVDRYDVDRDRPDMEGTSALSPYLHFGQIGPRQIVAALKAKADLSAKGPFVYLKEVYWREFAYNVLYHFPHTANEPLRPEFNDFPWKRDDDLLEAWQRGQTGYPIVDAGMRQLWRTGWMHNRVRMIAASFLVKHLLHSWKEGAIWFWDTLLDADLASNSLGWQWSGGCGADAAPYFRVFNPIIQGKKFDPEGAFVRRFVPELGRLPDEYIHTPWEAPPAVLSRAGIELGASYPRPLIEHDQGRKRALAAFETFKAVS
ncbi:MAG: cryptochrome/photolyase family protein [Opitutales bacterium]